MAKFPWQKGQKPTPASPERLPSQARNQGKGKPPERLPPPASEWGGELAKEYWKHGRKKL